ncbi:MAG: tetratricopeptide repeat protein [Microcoleus sp.]
MNLQQQAELYLATGNIDRAIALCEEVLAVNPDSAEACKTLGKALQAAGKLEDARYWYKVAIERKPDFAEVFANLGALSATLEQWDEAIDFYQQAISLQPDVAGFYRNLSRVFDRSGKAEEATDFRYQALMLEPSEIAEDYLELGNTFLAQNKLTKAQSCYHKTIYLNSSFCEAYYKLADVASELQKWDEAIVNYQKAIKLQPDMSELYYKLGNVFQSSGRLTKAVTAYRASLDLNPNSFWCYYNLGSVLMKLEFWEAALVAYRTTAEINPDFSWSFYSIGEACRKLGKLSEAEVAYQRAVELDPNYAGFFHNLGDVLFQLEKWSDAEVAYQRAIDLDPEFFWSDYNLALTLVKLQKWPAAEVAYRRAIELNPDFPWSYHNLGEVLLKTQQWQAAAVAYRRAIELNPNIAWSYYNLGDALTAIGDWNGAVSAYLDALLIDSSLPKIYTKLGKVLPKRIPAIPDAAISYYHEMQPLHSPAFYCQLAQKFAEENQQEAAAVLYLMALEIKPNDPDISRDLENILAQNNATEAESVVSEITINDIRDRYIARVVKGKTFAEVGGLWGTVNEKISVASKYGATSLTAIDAAPISLHLWQDFRDRMTSLNITNYNCISRDVTQIQFAEIGEPYDVVHCAGVLYHHPNPLQIMTALRQITREYLILTSAIAQEVIENEWGRYQIPASGVIFIPAITAAERTILKAYWEAQTQGKPIFGIIQPAVFDLNDFGPWWWLPTASALEAMCQVAGFKVLDKGLTWNNNAMSLLLGV